MGSEGKGGELNSANNSPTDAAKMGSEGERRSIFRDQALRHYLEGREKEVLPRLVSQRMFLSLWALLVLLAVAVGGGAYLVKVPDYTSGPAIVLDKEAAGRYGGGTLVAAFLAPEYLPDLKKDEKLLLRLDPGGRGLPRPIAAVEPNVVSPKTARARFGLGDAAVGIRQPSAVVVAALEPLPRGAANSNNSGAIYWADVEVGSRTALSLFPVVEKLVEG